MQDDKPIESPYFKKANPNETQSDKKQEESLKNGQPDKKIRDAIIQALIDKYLDDYFSKYET